MSVHRYVLHNNEIREAGEKMLSPGQLGLLAGWGVFSTVRVLQGAIFAWERHWARMAKDARLLNVKLPFDPAQVEQNLMRLVEANGHPECTLRVVAVRNAGGFWQGPGTGRDTDLIALTADLNQWSESVRLGMQSNARFAANEFAGAKILSWAQNLTWVERAHNEGFDECMLLNERGAAAECTSANIFAAFGGTVATPPLSDGCLPGITREVLLECRNVAGIQVVERSLRPEDLYSADEVFITSTTRDLLPVSEIAGRKLRSNPDARMKLTAYLREFIDADIAARVASRSASGAR
jgi:branched-chain amino acid aminotransferase